MNALGKHILLDYYECNPEIINDILLVEQIMVRSAELSGANIVKIHFHHFSPQGISGVIVIQESHFAIHTWPEHRFASVDFFTCNEKVNTDLAAEFIKEQFHSQYLTSNQVSRGAFLQKS